MSELKIETSIKTSIVALVACRINWEQTWGCVRGIVLSGALVGTFVACRGQEQSGNGANSSSTIVSLPPASQVLLVPVGVPAGVINNIASGGFESPYARNAAAIAQGGQIIVEMNCVGCHGYDLKGGMGPDLTDTYWRYGGSPALIFKSIYEGRPQGMPAWGDKLSPDVIWKMVAYIQSLGGAFPSRFAEQGRQGNLGDSDAVADLKEARNYFGNKGRQSDR